MPDPNAIALATVDRLTPLTLQLARSSLQSVLRNGNVVEARVVGMLAKDVAQLEILGQKVEVSTPQALKAGTTISVAINRTPGSLQLIIQPDAHGARAPQSSQPTAALGRGYAAPVETAGSLRASAASIGERVLAAQAAINEAVLSAGQSANIAPPSSQLVMNAAYSEARFASEQLNAEVQAAYEQESHGHLLLAKITLRPAAALNWSFGRIPMALARRQRCNPPALGPAPLSQAIRLAVYCSLLRLRLKTRFWQHRPLSVKRR